MASVHGDSKKKSRVVVIALVRKPTSADGIVFWLAATILQLFWQAKVGEGGGEEKGMYAARDDLFLIFSSAVENIHVTFAASTSLR